MCYVFVCEVWQETQKDTEETVLGQQEGSVVKVIVSKPEYLSPTPVTHVVEGENAVSEIIL